MTEASENSGHPPEDLGEPVDSRIVVHRSVKGLDGLWDVGVDAVGSPARRDLCGL